MTVPSSAAASEPQAPPRGGVETLPDYQCPAADRHLLSCALAYLRGDAGSSLGDVETAFRLSTFPKTSARIAMLLYQPGRKRLVVIRRNKPGRPVLSDVLNRLRAHPRFPKFQLNDPHLHLQLEFLHELSEPFDLNRVGMSRRGEAHFEIGLEGLRFQVGETTRYFFPGDAYVRSIMAMSQLRDWLKRATRVDDLGTVQFQRFRSESYISYGDDWLRLYRGQPLLGPLSKARLDQAIRLAIEHVRDYQRDDGRFLYYYDAATDSQLDHDHPERDPERNPYYNILRHCGGILTCLYYSRYSGERVVLAPAQQAIDFILDQSRIYSSGPNQEAAYVYYNRKAKLGGTGLALYALSEYQKLTGDRSYSGWAARYCRHLLGQITDSGEFIYYHIYLNDTVGPEDNHRYFSFYYPGEALCGLAAYYKHVCDDPDLKARIEHGIKKALHYLLVDRPLLRAEHYTKLPSDSWLMMAINELWDVETFRNTSYSDFVFSDADTMVSRMYREADAPYPDYRGAFYYEHGDYPYADGARCEGLLGAFELAHKVGDAARIASYESALLDAAWATLHLVNFPQFLYFAKNPQKALGGIRFKYTRQWFRIDTIQHVACFYLKALIHGQCTLPPN